MTGSPQRFGPYRLIRSLARGGMGEVFVALRDGATQICVLKLLHAEMETREIAARRFHREAHVASYLQHPNIAQVLDAGEIDGRFFIAMEFIAGQDLEALMGRLVQQGRMLPPAFSVAAICRVLEGLEYAHDAIGPEGRPIQLVHRDLSPRNVMVDYSGRVRIIDFGLVRSKVGDFNTAPGMFMGTLRYVSPEQALTESVDRRSDLYTIAVVLHEMLTGRNWLSLDGKMFDILREIIQTDLPRVDSIVPTLGAPLADVVQRGLTKERDDRWPTAREFREALEAAAPKWAATSELQMGQFVRQHFEDGLIAAQEVMTYGERDPDEAGLTRTGYHPQSAPTDTEELMPTLLATHAAEAPTWAGTVPGAAAPSAARPPRSSNATWVAAALILALGGGFVAWAMQSQQKTVQTVRATPVAPQVAPTLSAKPGTAQPSKPATDIASAVAPVEPRPAAAAKRRSRPKRRRAEAPEAADALPTDLSEARKPSPPADPMAEFLRLERRALSLKKELAPGAPAAGTLTDLLAEFALVRPETQSEVRTATRRLKRAIAKARAGAK